MDGTDINEMVLRAKNNIPARNQLIESNMGFIRRTSSYICSRNLDWSNDDELSIALMAFNDAIDSFAPDKGSGFFTYCRMLIHSRLIDYFRKTSSSSAILNSSFEQEELSALENREAMDRYSIEYAAQERSMEIKLFNKELSKYKLSLSELTTNSPKHMDTRKMLFHAAIKCAGNREIMKYLKKNRMLPIKQIIEVTGAKRKFLDQWRKYLISLIIIVSSDEYVYLKEYIDFDDKKVVV